MTTIQDQLQWEEHMIERGVSRFRAQDEKATKAGRGAETSSGSRLLRSYVLQVSDHMRSYLDGKLPNRRRHKYAKLIAAVDTDKVAMIALRHCISGAIADTPKTIQTVLSTIGQMIEDELRFSKFHTEHTEYYETVVRRFEENKTADYRYKHRSLAHSMEQKGVAWEDWPAATRIGVGALVVALMMESSDLIEKVTIKKPRNRKEVRLALTENCLSWILDHNAAVEVTSPDRMPCIVQPDDWVSPTQGGYYSPKLRRLTPLVKGLFRGGEAERRDRLMAADMPDVLSAINAMQRTGWSVNTKVLAVMQEVWSKNLGVGMPPSQPYEIPHSPVAADVVIADLDKEGSEFQAFTAWKTEARELYTMERERVSQNLALIRTLRLASEMDKQQEFYYVYQCDFRGRVYAAASGLSPQGTDHGKALLQFSDAQPLGSRGLYWLKVHGANKFGEDSCSNDARVAWVEERHTDWLEVADDPIGNRAIWGAADKPYQFLAFCFEYAEAHYTGDTFRSCLPVALDGSCNGLQHFSAMLRDAVGGSAVNLVPNETPADIYKEVASVCTRKLTGLRALNNEHHAGAVNWMQFFAEQGEQGMPRSLSKKPVMTLPYGSTQRACTESVFRWAKEKSPNFFEQNTAFKHALYLSPVLWSSIGEVVIAARDAMAWIQNSASLLAKHGRPLSYTSPLGFPVHQATRRIKSKLIETQIGGKLYLRVAESTDALDTRKQRQASSPNLVHSVDGTHLLMSVNAGVQYGIGSFAMIHDDFGVHARYVDGWNRIIREEFVALHTKTDILAEFKREHEFKFGIELPALPKKGCLDLDAVLNSQYFFN